jgi:hypothetical protein
MGKFLSIPLLCLLLATTAHAENKKEHIVLLHGIARSSSSMSTVADLAKKAGYNVINIDYDSTNKDLLTLARKLDRKLKAKKLSKPMHFITHSMGGLLTRVYIAHHRPTNLGSVAMLGPPNKGSEVADWLKENLLYQTYYGPAGQELGTKQGKTLTSLLPIDYPLGIIAGNQSIDPISSNIIPGNDDGKVSIENTKIDGMKDHIVMSTTHAFMMHNDDVVKQALYFIKNGKFSRN